MNTVMIGSDVEYYKTDATDLDTYELALSQIGSKSKPSIGPYGPYHSDQTWAERATQPHTCLSDLLEDLEWGKIHLESTMGMPLKGVSYIEQRFNRETHPFLYQQAGEFGCSPDLWMGRYRNVPPVIKARLLREAGAHIHFNLPRVYTDTLYDTRCPRTGETLIMERGIKIKRIAQELTRVLAPYHAWDHPTERPWYRKPGVYRLKPYGLEYRSLGAGILSDPDMLAGAFGTAFEYLTDIWKGHTS